MEYKAVPTEFKVGAVNGQYEGYFSVFGNVDDGMDIITSGAFTKTLQERGRRIKVFFAHDWSKLIGPPPDIIQEDAHGLYAKGRLTLGSFWGNEAWQLIKDGAMTEGSIGFETISNQIDYLPSGVRALKELKLYEISPVPLGMNSMTEVQAAKMLGRQSEAERYGALMALLAELKAGRVLSAANTERLRAAMTAMQDAMDAMDALMQTSTPADDSDAGKAAVESTQLRQRRLRAAAAALALRQSS